MYPFPPTLSMRALFDLTLMQYSAIAGILAVFPLLNSKIRTHATFKKNSVFHSLPLQNASIPFQIAGVVKNADTKTNKNEKKETKKKKT